LELEFGLAFLVEALLEYLGAESLARAVFPELASWGSEPLAPLGTRQVLAVQLRFRQQHLQNLPFSAEGIGVQFPTMGQRFVQLQEAIKGGL
jgi:hypothetical protein